MLISEFESAEISRDDMTAYNHLRIGFVDLAVKALQSLQYMEVGGVDTNLTEHGFVHAKYGYTFDATPENIDANASFQLLRASLSILLRLAPTTGSSSNMDAYHRHTFGVDFAACLKESSAIHSLQRHLGAASNIASLTYEVVHDGAPTRPVAIIHNNAVDIVHSITTFFRCLTDSGSMVVDFLLLLLENRCFGSLIDIPLLKMTKKKWISTVSDEAISTVARHRGYYTNYSMQAGNASSSRKNRPLMEGDPVHIIWREVISIFSSLMRSMKCQADVYAKVDEHIMGQLNQVYSVVLDFLCTYENELFSCFSSMSNEARSQPILEGGKTKSSSFSSIQPSSFAFTPNLIKEAADVSSLFAELCKGDSRVLFSSQCNGIYRRLLSTSLGLSKVMSLFLGSIGNARELFMALSSANSKMVPSSAMFDHPMLAEGIPNARHEAIRNAHFAHSCCILATAQDFANSHIATTKAAESAAGKDSCLEKSFQIFVNNKLIVEVEQVAGHCLLNTMNVLADTHPALDSFIFFSHEEVSRLDVASAIRPGTTVALCPQRQFRRYCVHQSEGAVQYARTIGCDRSTRTISVEYTESGTAAQNVPWSSIVGVEDVSKKQCMFTYGPSPKSIGDADNHDPPSLGHLILALHWCRHVASIPTTDNANKCSRLLIECVVERVVSLLCTEVLLQDEIRGTELYDDNITRKVNMQLLDLFEFADSKSTSRRTPVGSKGLASVMDDDQLESIRRNLKRHLQSAACLREEEQKLWQLNNAGWDSTGFWGSSSTKRQGRRSPFRLTKSSSIEFP